MKVKPSLLLNTSLRYATPISTTETLRLAANVKLFKTTLLWNKRLIYHYLSLLWQRLMMRFITNRDHAHLSKSMKNDGNISITCMKLWAFYYALGAHSQCTICHQEQLKETMQARACPSKTYTYCMVSCNCSCPQIVHGVCLPLRHNRNSMHVSEILVSFFILSLRWAWSQLVMKRIVNLCQRRLR